MSKRARQAALMGFATGALSDVLRRREQSRMEEAQALKEERLAAIRAQERGEDRAFSREQFEASKIARTEDRAADREFRVEDREDTQSFTQDQRARDAAERSKDRESARATQLEAARISASARSSGGGSGGRERKPDIKSYVNEATGKVGTFDVNNPDDLKRLKTWQQTSPVRPYYKSSDTGGGYAPPSQSPPPQAARGDMMSAPAAPAPVSQGPKIGDVVAGYRYKGGPAGSQSSWEPM